MIVERQHVEVVLGEATVERQGGREEASGGDADLDVWDKQSSTSTATTYVGGVEYQHVETAKLGGEASLPATAPYLGAPGGGVGKGLAGTTQPPNFNLVMPGVYRSSFPQAENWEFVQGMQIKTVVTLVQKEKFPQGYEAFLQTSGIQHRVFDMKGTKKEAIPTKTMRAILAVVLDTQNFPVLIHCNHGKHRTGCVVGIVRRLAGWDLASILSEYEAHAAPKARACDVDYIVGFDLADLAPAGPLPLLLPFPARGAAGFRSTIPAGETPVGGGGGGFLRSSLAAIVVVFVWIVEGTRSVAARLGAHGHGHGQARRGEVAGGGLRSEK